MPAATTAAETVEATEATEEIEMEVEHLEHLEVVFCFGTLFCRQTSSFDVSLSCCADENKRPTQETRDYVGLLGRRHQGVAALE